MVPQNPTPDENFDWSAAEAQIDADVVDLDAARNRRTSTPTDDTRTTMVRRCWSTASLRSAPRGSPWPVSATPSGVRSSRRAR